MRKLTLNNLNLSELENIALSLNEPKYRAGQLYQWLYKEKINKISKMTNLSKKFRDELENISEIDHIEEITKAVSKKDGSIKFLFGLSDGERVESVLLKDGERVTACISSQVGCKMGCTFCETAKIGFKRNLNVSEILSQVTALERVTLDEGMTEGRLTNIVFMGMGEPLDNFDNVYKALEILMNENGYGYSHKRITVSTAGIVPRIKDIYKLETPVNLAISLNAASQEVRKSIMPISNKYPLHEVLAELKKVPINKRKKFTMEYVLLKNINDSKEDAQKLVKVLGKIPVKINLIRYNAGKKTTLVSSSWEDAEKFQKILTDAGLTAFIRKSLGSDIAGACGQLAAEY